MSVERKDITVKKTEIISCSIAIAAFICSFLAMYFQFFYEEESIEVIMTDFNMVKNELHIDFIFVNHGTERGILLEAYPAEIFLRDNGLSSPGNYRESGKDYSALPLILDPDQIEFFKAKIKIFELKETDSNFFNHHLNKTSDELTYGVNIGIEDVVEWIAMHFKVMNSKGVIYYPVIDFFITGLLDKNTVIFKSIRKRFDLFSHYIPRKKVTLIDHSNKTAK